MDPWDLLPCLGRLLTMSAVPTGSTPSEREIQIAIAPLETLLNEDLGEAAASVDHSAIAWRAVVLPQLLGPISTEG